MPIRHEQKGQELPSADFTESGDLVLNEVVGDCVLELVPEEDLSESLNDLSEGKCWRKWKVCIIESCISDNSNWYRPEVLREAAKLWEGAPIRIYSFDGRRPGQSVHNDHVPGWVAARDAGCVTGNTVGATRDCKVESIPSTRPGRLGQVVPALTATLTFVDDSTARRISEAWRSGLMPPGKKALFQLSIEAEGPHTDTFTEGRRVRRVEKISRVRETTMVSDGAAGGCFLEPIKESLREAGDDSDEMDFQASHEEATETWDNSDSRSQRVLDLVEAYAQNRQQGEMSWEEASDLARIIEAALVLQEAVGVGVSKVGHQEQAPEELEQSKKKIKKKFIKNPQRKPGEEEGAEGKSDPEQDKRFQFRGKEEDEDAAKDPNREKGDDLNKDGADGEEKEPEEEEKEGEEGEGEEEEEVKDDDSNYSVQNSDDDLDQLKKIVQLMRSGNLDLAIQRTQDLIAKAQGEMTSAEQEGEGNVRSKNDQGPDGGRDNRSYIDTKASKSESSPQMVMEYIGWKLRESKEKKLRIAEAMINLRNPNKGRSQTQSQAAMKAFLIESQNNMRSRNR